MTNMFTRVRNAALIALALGTIVAGAAPVQALSLKQLPEMGSNDHHDCDSRRDAKIYFQQLGLKHVEVSKTHERHVYIVKGLAPAPEEEVELRETEKSSKSDYIRYVILFDGCDHSNNKILKPAP